MRWQDLFLTVCHIVIFLLSHSSLNKFVYFVWYYFAFIQTFLIQRNWHITVFGIINWLELFHQVCFSGLLLRSLNILPLFYNAIFYFNPLLGYTELRKLTMLSVLRLDNNQLTGTIPVGMCIKYVICIYNIFCYFRFFVYFLIAVIGNLTFMTNMWLGVNSLTGTIPEGINMATRSYIRSWLLWQVHAYCTVITSPFIQYRQIFNVTSRFYNTLFLVTRGNNTTFHAVDLRIVITPFLQLFGVWPIHILKFNFNNI